MQSYQIIADSSCDIPISIQKEMNIHTVPFSATFDTVNYYKELIELTPDIFYQKIKNSSVFPKTSLPSIMDYTEVFEPYLKEGTDILCICLSSKFSGSFQSAVNAKNELGDKYPKRKIYILDSMGATGSEGLLVLEGIRMRDAGLPFDALVETLEQLKKTSKINFTVDSLEHLQKGGRIGRAAALAGTILNIKPIIGLSDGELHPETKVRGQKKAQQTLLDMTRKEIGENKEHYRIVLIRAEIERESAALLLAQELKAEGFDVSDAIWTVGVTIGAHAGPTAIGVCYIKKYEYLV